MTWAQALITAGGACIAAFFGYLGVRATVRRGRSADRLGAEQQRDANLVAELKLQYDRNNEILRRIDALETKLDAEQERRESLARELDDERREREHLTSLYVSLERRFQEALVYIRSLLALVRENDLTEPVAPEWLTAAIPRDEGSNYGDD